MKIIKKLALYSFAIASSFLISSLALAENSNNENATIPDWHKETLTGDWGGIRKSLYQNGVDIGLTHKSDVLSNVSGGVNRGTAWIGHSEARVAVDLEKLAGWNSTIAYFHFHSDQGSKFNSHYVGSMVGVDNVEVATNTAQFFHAWIQKSFFNEGLSVLAGIYPIDSEFYVTDTSGLFIQPPYGMSNEVAKSGRSGPPVFPVGALAVRTKYTTPQKNFYLMGAFTDGVPGNPNNPHGTQIVLGRGDGTLTIIEIGYTPQNEPVAKSADQEESELFNKTAIGFWRYSSQLADLDTNTTQKHPSQGAYFLAERTLYLEAGHPSQGLSGFIRFGVANADTQQTDWTSSTGLRYHGLIPGRDDDIAGIAVTVNHASDKYRRLNTSNSHETDVELTYRAQIKPWLALQPDLQYIANPNMDKTIKNAWVVGLRTEISF